MATFVKINGAYFQKGTDGLTAVSDPVALRDLTSGRTQAENQSIDTATGGGATPQVPAPTGGVSSPYDIFSKNLMTLLQNAQKVGDPSALLKSKEQLTNQSLNLSNPLNATPYKSLFGMMNPGQSVNAQQGTEQAFNPGLTSVTDQLNAGNAALKTFGDTVQTAYDVNKPIAVGAGTSLVSPGGQTIFQGGKYTPTFNYQKGIMDGFDSVTGTWASDAAVTGTSPTAAGGPTPAIQRSLIGGVDFSGQSTGVGAYAADPNYEKAIGAIYAGIQQSLPQPSSVGIDAYIKGHAKGSPITGQMIMNAANQYGVDPLLLTSVLAQESDFGTAGAAVSTMNAGNVGNTGTSTRSFNSWQAGVSATAEQLKRRMPTAGAQPVAQPPAQPTTGRLSKDVLATLSPVIVPAYRETSNGYGYFDAGKLDATGSLYAKTVSAKYGVPILDNEEVTAVQGVDTALKNLNTLESSFNALASGNLGAYASNVSNPLSKIFDTDYGSKLKAFQMNRESLFQQVSTLANSHPRLNAQDLLIAANSMPKLDEFNHDTLKDGAEKLKLTRQYLGNSLGTILPTAGAATGMTGKIRVQIGNQTGTIDASEFNPDTMKKL